jgi:hypothetical protein
MVSRGTSFKSVTEARPGAARKCFPFANLPASFTPCQGMTKTLRSLLISAALSMPVLAQPGAPSDHSYLDEVFFPKLKTNQQVVELVKQAGFKPTLNEMFGFSQFEAVTPRCTIGVWFTISDDGNDLLFTSKLRELTGDEAQHTDDLLARLNRSTPPRKFAMFFEVMGIGAGKPVLLLNVKLPNRGALPSEVTAVVSQLADVGVATVTARH